MPKTEGKAKWEAGMLRTGFHQSNPAKRRRLAFMKARYTKPPTCKDCEKVALWSWTGPGHRCRFFCDDHLPEAARNALGRVQTQLFEVAPFFDEAAEEDSEWTFS